MVLQSGDEGWRLVVVEGAEANHVVTGVGAVRQRQHMVRTRI